MKRQLTDAELIALADAALRMIGPREARVRPGSLLWTEAVRMIASHLKFLQQHGRPVPRVLTPGPDGEGATPELFQQVRDRLRATVVAEAERHANGKSP